MDTLATLTALSEAARALGVSRDLDALLDTILARAAVLIGGEHWALLLPEGGLLRVRRVRGYGARRDEVLARRLRLSEGICGWAALHRTPVRLGDVQVDPRYVAGLLDARSNLAVPLLVRDEVVGVLVAESSEADAFTLEQEHLLVLFSAQAALAIEASQSRERLEQRLSELNALYRISRLAAEQPSLDAVLEGMLQVAGDVLPEGPSAILLLDPEARVLRVRAALGFSPALQGREVPVGQGLVGRCAETAELTLTNTNPSSAAGGRLGSAIAVPLLTEGRVMGVLTAESSQPKAFKTEHQRTLTVIAQQAAIVLRSAQLQEEMRRLALTDPLTGLANRRQFVHELGEHLRRVRRYGGRVAVVLIDLDGLKPLNDRLGHGAGDSALQGIARLMRAWVRETDMVARIGGDEFAGLLLEANPDEVIHVVERLRVNVATTPLRLGEVEQTLTLSAGVARFPDEAQTLDGLLARADAALYEAKHQGRNRVVLATVPG